MVIAFFATTTFLSNSSFEFKKKEGLLQGETENILIELSRIYFVATTWYKSSSAGEFSLSPPLVPPQGGKTIVHFEIL